MEPPKAPASLPEERPPEQFFGHSPVERHEEPQEPATASGADEQEMEDETAELLQGARRHAYIPPVANRLGPVEYPAPLPKRPYGGPTSQSMPLPKSARASSGVGLEDPDLPLGGDELEPDLDIGF
jgi:hypothetical protein